MSSGYGAGYADVIEEKHLKKICSLTLKAFNKAVSDAGADLGQVATAIEYNDANDIDLDLDDDKLNAAREAIIKAWKKLEADFHKKTGLELGMGYHSSENNGDCYDDIDGAYFSVRGYWQVTPAGKRLEKKYGSKKSEVVTRQFFVQYG